MSCADGAAYQCSGATIIRIDNGIALTNSGVQTYGKSTSDLANPIADVTTAKGLVLAAGGSVEARVRKQDNGSVTIFALLLNKIGLSWDGATDRPAIIETFNSTQGKVSVDENGALAFGTLPDSANLDYYDYAIKGAGGTQANYANNRYFPRSSPSRCPPGYIGVCPTAETAGILTQAGDWHNGGQTADSAHAIRLHEDGDVHAGNGKPDQNGNPTVLPDGTGIGAPYPGSKGFRTYDGWSFQYANLGAWMTQDTVQISEWGPGLLEHNKNRRGVIAFGAVSPPAAMPSAGTKTYTGIASGWYVPTATNDVQPFLGSITVTANFATRQVIVTLQNPATSDNMHASLPFAFAATVGMGAVGKSVANYLNGSVNAGSLSGGLGGRFFGPTTGNGTDSPAEIGGAFSLSSSTTGQVVLAGFIARKQ